ncbi:hypothetical protein CDD83_8005 [Cordyceps sp. RAO-2017]|nr:hypothetical protein CDD83_8005 [Cordyceps sp. RAO-2017]
MTTYAYPSTFPVESSGGAATDPEETQSTNESQRGAFASFICHVAHLESVLQPDKSFFDEARRKAVARTRLGYGTSFLVDRVEMPAASGDAAGDSRFAVIKTVRQSAQNPMQWRDVLLEIRVLLHKPIRYHPNIVRLLGIGWDNSSEIASPFPALIQEYAEFGTLAKLQADNKSLPFNIKQKLCYDVGRGLSILHACGIIHGDLKHENVLVFANKYSNPPDQPYTAKVADFGGSVMDVREDSGTHILPMSTFPYEAPEIGQRLSVDGVKKTDAFSYGMLIWRCMLDCANVLATIGFIVPPGRPREEQRTALNKLKSSDELLEGAIASLTRHAETRRLPRKSLGLIVTSLMFTLRGDPAQRALDRAQSRMRGMSASASHEYVSIKDVANKKMTEGLQRSTPGQHGIDMDGVGYALGRMAGDDYDAQNNLPGFRPDLPHPEKGGFLFEPLKLRRLLAWEQQKNMVDEFVAAAEAPRYDSSAAGLEPWSASFFLYQSFLSGFGVRVDAEEACRWLRSAAKPSEETAGVDYLAGAWLVRAHRALGVASPLTPDEQVDTLYWGLIRGHRHCGADARAMIEASSEAGQREGWEDRMMEADWNWRCRTCATGMPFFISRRLTRQWDAEDVATLDETIKAELGDAYESCLRPALRDEDPVPLEPAPDGGNRFDRIYVNNKGHGLLHLAATLGKVDVLRHVHRKYKCDISLSNQSHSDTPLTCACRAANLDCALYLLENGADANGTQFGQESPLHCIVNFAETEMERIVKKLLEAGADIEKSTSASRKDVRGILSDWEDNSSIRLAPLGRAVLFQSLPAVRVLLRYGASPWGSPRQADDKPGNVHPIQLAALLTLPEILQAMLTHSPTDSDPDAIPLFDECGMLQKARSGDVTRYDPLSLQSRIIRCGSQYKESLARTLGILRDRRLELGLVSQETSPGAQLCTEIGLGNRDIVEVLLDLGHALDGSVGNRPVEAAVTANNDDIFFSVLVKRGASLSFADDEKSGRPLLLALAATRPHYTPRGTRIVEYLLSQGVSPEPRTQQQPSALTLAIKNGYMDLADVLVSRTSAESINAFHAWSDGGDAESVLGMLLSDHSNSNLQAISYLAEAHGNSASDLQVHPQVNKTKGLSAVHMLAQWPPSEWNDHSQISARIAQLVLAMFPDPQALGEHHVHPTLGTPLCAAVLAGNKNMVSILLESPYRSDVEKPVVLEKQLGEATAKESWTPLRLINQAMETEARRLNSMLPAGRREDIDITKLMDSLDMMAQLNTAQGSPSALPTAQQIAQIKRQAEVALRQPRAAPVEDASDVVAADAPVDLSIISEEKPTHWHEGVEMTEIMALRTFLRSFRSKEGVFGDQITIFMDKSFNKRPPELGAPE